MASTRGIRAGPAYVEFYAQDNRLVRGLNRAAKKLRAFGSVAREIGAKLLKPSAVMAAPFARECLFLGAAGSKRGADDPSSLKLRRAGWEITYRFAASPNRTGITVGEITGIAKKGWEYPGFANASPDKPVGPLRRRRGHGGQGHRQKARGRVCGEGV